MLRKGKEKGIRGPGFLVNSKTLKDAYRFYKENLKSKGLKGESKKIYTKVCKDFNKEIVNLIVYKSEEVKLPCGMGNIAVLKFAHSLSNIPQNKWPINWKKTKELGYKVYFVEDYIYDIRWYKKKAQIRNKEFYKFIACRDFKRAVPKALRENKVDYFSLNKK